jgi:hypothetical protein
MTRINRSRSLLRRALCAVALTALVPTLAQGAHQDKKPMTETAAPKGFRTHCIGRYLIDLPETVDIKATSSDYRWMRVAVRASTRDAYLAEANAFEGQLRATAHKKDPSLLRHVERSRDENTISIVFWEKPFTTYQSQIRGFRWLSGSLLTANDKADADRIDIGLANTNKVLTEFRPRAPDEIPSEPGFCIDGGYFVGVPEANQEEASIRLTLKNHPDVWIDITTDTIGTEQVVDAGLLARVDKGMSIPLPLDIRTELAKVRTLRRGQHAVGPVKAEELLEAMPNKTGLYAHQFRWEAFGERAQILAPSIVVEFETGKNTEGNEDSGQPSLTDAEAIALFDTIVNSIRLRPTAPAKASSVKPPPTPLGELAATGRACPQAGLWRSQEGEVREIQVGEVMPRTVVTAALSLWQKLRGDTEQVRIATVWTLVTYTNQAVDSVQGASAAGDTA